MTTRKQVVALIFVYLAPWQQTTVTAFTAAVIPFPRAPTTREYGGRHASVALSRTVLEMAKSWEQQPGESKQDYLKRMQLAASDPKAFERMVSSSVSSTDTSSRQKSKSTDRIEHDSTNDNTINGAQTPKKGGYVPIEQWDAQRSKDDMSWEERVQHDGRRHGNRFLQNEILRKNLNTFF